MPKEAIKNSTELKKVLHLGTQSKPLPRNLFKFRAKLTGSVFSLRIHTEMSFRFRPLKNVLRINVLDKNVF